MSNDDVPEALRLSYYVGEIVVRDSWAEHEARVLWGVLRVAGLVGGERWPAAFGRLLPVLENGFARPEVPAELRELALPVLATTRQWHRYRNDLVHDLPASGWGRGDDVLSAIGKHPPRPMAQLAECGATLTVCGYRLRGLWIIAPWWIGGELDSWAEAEGMRSWTRVVMGHLTGEPSVIRGTPGPSPEPPGGWDKLVADEVVKREAEDARLAGVVVEWASDDEAE